MFNLFSKRSQVYAELIRAASQYMMVTGSEGTPMPDMAGSYYTGKYGVALWSLKGEAGFVVLQSVAGVWVALGAEAGLCEVTTLRQQFSVPYAEAEQLSQQVVRAAAACRASLRGAPLGDLSFCPRY